MICPECRTEYREGYSHCTDCEVLLVDSVPEEQESGEPDAEIVKVFEGGNAAILPLVESMLHDANIEFLVKGEALQDLFGFGRFGIGIANNTIGPVEIWVRKEEEAAAREIIAVLDTPAAEDEPSSLNDD